jgi:hypothetical protein
VSWIALVLRRHVHELKSLSKARIFFKAGKNCDGYFVSKDVLAQVNTAIDIFKRKSGGKCTGLFMFDNAPSHQKRASDALTALDMPLNIKTWMPKTGIKMRDG